MILSALAVVLVVIAVVARIGVVVPTRGDVGWYVGTEWKALWKGTITGFEVLPRR